jgi:hypothetical protein
MKHSKTGFRMMAAGLALAAILAVTAPAAVPSEEAEDSICRRALLNCLSDLADGPFGLWNLAFKLSFCLSGNEFCKKFVEPFL